MATMNVSLPEQMRNWVKTQTGSGLYANSSDYVRDLIRRDQQRANELKALQAEITTGIDDVRAGRVSGFDVESIVNEGKRQLARRDS